jgi:hypothetical protein
MKEPATFCTLKFKKNRTVVIYIRIQNQVFDFFREGINLKTHLDTRGG